MAKDPAFLFYPAEWLGGTMLLTRHQKGCYIDLLMAQFNSGPLSLEEIRTILGQDQASWTVLSRKFKQDQNGLFYNERLLAEQNKRTEYSVKQSERIKKRWDKKKLYRGINHGNTTVIPSISNSKKKEKEEEKEKTAKAPPDFFEVEKTFIKHGGSKEMATKFFNTYQALGWMIKQTPIQNFIPLALNYIQKWQENELKSNGIPEKKFVN